MESIKSQKELSKRLKEEAKRLGFNPVGIARIPGSSRVKLRTEALERWLNSGHHAEMKWMEAPRRKNIETLLEGVKSVVAVGLNYYVDSEINREGLQIARYAWGKDYHKTIQKRLKKLGKWLENYRPDCKWKACVDTSALMDKVWAEEAGIGWIGKNGNLINKKSGSWMVLGNLLCTEKLTEDTREKPSCDSCEKCIDACPTKAIEEPFVINSNQCLAYHTIENRQKELPKEIKNYLGKWIAGCDICQEVCPWNQQKLESNYDPEVQPREWVLNLNEKEAMEWNDEEWKNHLQGSALKRIKPWMWRRNIKATQNK